MPKNIIIAGDFDCLTLSQLHLIKEAKKFAIPGGDVVVLLFSDYTKFLIDKTFPVQSLNRRKKNLEYFIKRSNIIIVDTSDYEAFLDSKLPSLKDFVYMHYESDKDFLGRWKFKKYEMQVKFIKEPKI